MCGGRLFVSAARTCDTGSADPYRKGGARGPSLPCLLRGKCHSGKGHSEGVPNSHSGYGFHSTKMRAQITNPAASTVKIEL